jgi:hypothetical protein
MKTTQNFWGKLENDENKHLTINLTAVYQDLHIKLSGKFSHVH